MLNVNSRREIFVTALQGPGLIAYGRKTRISSIYFALSIHHHSSSWAPHFYEAFRCSKPLLYSQVLSF